MKWKKKALSEVVVTIAIALLTVGAVTIIVAFVVPFVKDNLDSSTECLDYQDYFKFYEDFGYNCRQNGSYVLSVQAGNLDEEQTEGMKGLILEFSTSGGESVPVEVFDGASSDASEGGIRMLNVSKSELEIPGPRGVKSYVYNSSTIFSRISVYAVLDSGRVCEKESDLINIEGEICE